MDDLPPSPFRKILKEILDLSQDDWKSFLYHARNGFADYEKAYHMETDGVLRLRDVPPEWLDDSDAMGHVLVRVARDGKPELAGAVAWYLLQLLEPENPDERMYAPIGTGLAWLALERDGLAPPIDAALLGEVALECPDHFFHEVAEDDMLPLCRLVLESKAPVEARHLHALFTALDRARLSGHVPFKNFDKLMAADWLTTEAKREFCRGVLHCQPETERLQKLREDLRASWLAELQRTKRLCLGWMHIDDVGRGWCLCGLNRHAVFALVHNLGEPLRAVIEEFLRPSNSRELEYESQTLGALDLIGRYAREFDPEELKPMLRKVIEKGLAPARHAAYRVGAEHLGIEFARPALRDEAGSIRRWAAKVLETKTVRPARKASARARK
jgi:hypothetical protein